MDGLARLFTTQRALRTWMLTSLLCNMGIIITGAIVRLTGSGLGCPTWPQCSDSSYIPHAEMGAHGLIEFGNRTLTFVLLIAAIGALIAAYKATADRLLRRISWLILAGIAAQGILGGITVRMQLNPYIVGLHLLGSIALIVGCTWTVLRVWQITPEAVQPIGRWHSVVVFTLAMLSIYLGTLVTGSGPHSGDENAQRTGFNIEAVSRLHSVAVWALVAVTIAALVAFRSIGALHSFRFSLAFLVALLAQGIIGYVQYFLALPVAVVILHMIGTAVVTVLASTVLFGNRVIE